MKKRGFTLVEVLVGTFLMLIVFLGIFAAYQLGLKVVGLSRAKVTATSISIQKIEELRNLDYSAVLSTSTTETVNSIDYYVQSIVQCVDEERDGRAGAGDNCICDYKKVKVKTSWSGRFKGEVSLENIISPRNSVEECQAPAGVLAISVFDAEGEMVDELNPANIVEVKNVNTGTVYYGSRVASGEYEYIVDPGTDAYKIIVTKTGYSWSRTFAGNEIYNGEEIANPNNECFARPQASVFNAQRTEISFCIDKLSNFLVSTLEGRAKRILFVRKVGSDNNDGLTPDTAFLTIQKAGSVVQAGDWVIVGAGNYQERVEIQDSGTSDDYILFVADKNGIYTGDAGEVEISGKDFGFYISNQKYIEIYGFKIQNTTSSAIYVSGSNSGYLNLFQNTISNNTGDGIYIESSSNIDISQNEISLNKNGIYLKNSNFSQLTGNKVYQNSLDGIKIEGSSSIILNFNKSYSNGGIGILVAINSNNSQLKNNHTYLNNGDGIQVFDHASSIEVLNNKSYSNEGAGISFKGNISNANKILSNLVYLNSGPGILLSDNSTNNEILNNTSFQNQRGILIELSSNNNELKNNIIASSTLAGIKVSSSTNINEDYNDLWQNNPNYEGISAGTNSISANPLFVDPDGSDDILGRNNGFDDSFHLSQTAAGQATTSPGVDVGSASSSDLGLDNQTTRTDNVFDSGVVDLGFHYSLESLLSAIAFPDPFGPAIPNTQFNIRGEKEVGETQNNKPIYKYSTTTQTDSNGNLRIENLEWDNYLFSDFVTEGQELDLILSYPSQMPIYLAPNTTTTLKLGLKAENTLLVKTIDAQTSNSIAFSEIKITDGGITKVKIADENGEAYFIPLAQDWYQVQAKALGYATSTASVFVNGHVEKTISLIKE